MKVCCGWRSTWRRSCWDSGWRWSLRLGRQWQSTVLTHSARSSSRRRPVSTISTCSLATRLQRSSDLTVADASVWLFVVPVEQPGSTTCGLWATTSPQRPTEKHRKYYEVEVKVWYSLWRFLHESDLRQSRKWQLIGMSNDTAAHYAAIRCPRQRTIGPTVCS